VYRYLNVYGPHELGIYRISGSTSVVDDLRAEFKIRHDVDLFENPPDDLHTVSSLLKGWFRSCKSPYILVLEGGDSEDISKQYRTPFSRWRFKSGYMTGAKTKPNLHGHRRHLLTNCLTCRLMYISSFLSFGLLNLRRIIELLPTKSSILSFEHNMSRLRHQQDEPFKLGHDLLLNSPNR